MFFLLFPLFAFGQSGSVEDLLTAGTWNISYNISPDGERIEESNPDKIRSSWVKFHKDGTFEMPGGMDGTTKGKWEYDSQDNYIRFTEGRTKYKARVDLISEMGLELNYVDNGGFVIGLIHYIHVPKEKSNDEIADILTSGKWTVTGKNFGEIADKTPQSELDDTWYEFNSDYTYSVSEVFSENAVVRDGSWYLDEENQLVLDGSESSTYTVSGDSRIMVLIGTSGGFNTIEMRKK